MSPIESDLDPASTTTPPPVPEEEALELGTDDPAESFGLGDYPIDSLLIRQQPRTVFEILRRMRQGDTYILDPDFQRDFVWDEAKQSRLIESTLMRIPLPVFYLAEQQDGRIIVVDGLQRLTTFRRFFDGQFALKGLSHSRTLNGQRFENLAPKLQNRIEDTQLILYLIDYKVPEKARLDIFERVNSGVPLTRQQMRNSIYCGEATRWLKRHAQNEGFLRATGGSLDAKTMRDRELINRFCGFHLLGLDAYRGDMDAFLAETLMRMNDLNSGDLDRLGAAFDRSMANNFAVFGRHAFRKHHAHHGDDHPRNVINVALFDVFSVLMATHESFDANRVEAIRRAYFEMAASQEFIDAITFSTNSTRQVKTRFEMARRAFAETRQEAARAFFAAL